MWQALAQSVPVEVTTARANAHVDPSLHIWESEIPIYLFLGGLAGGLLILSAVLAFMARREGKPVAKAATWMPFTALGLLSIGMLFLFLDLAHKFYVWRFYLSFELTSPMSWGSWILMLVYPVGILLGLNLISEEARSRIVGFCPLARAGLPSPLCWLAAKAKKMNTGLWGLSIATGIALAVYTGILLGANGSRVVWNSALLGPLFLVSGISGAAAFLLLFRTDPDNEKRLLRFDIAAIVAELVLLGLLLIGYGNAGVGGRFAAAQFLGGPWSGSFWGLLIITGLILPLVLETSEQRGRVHASKILPIVVLFGGFMLRYIMVFSGQPTSIVQVAGF